MILYTKEGNPVDISAHDVRGKVTVLKVPSGPLSPDVAAVVDGLSALDPELLLILGPEMSVEAFDETNIGIHPKILKRILNRLLGVTECNETEKREE